MTKLKWIVAVSSFMAVVILASAWWLMPREGREITFQPVNTAHR